MIVPRLANKEFLLKVPKILISEDGTQCMRIRKLSPIETWRLMRV